MVSEHFSRKEMECKCGCGSDTVDVELITVLEEVREHFNAPVTINSGNRCPTHNREEGGSRGSQHIYCRAADFKVKGVSANRVADYLEKTYPDVYGIGRYKGRTHIDTKTGEKRRWDER